MRRLFILFILVGMIATCGCIGTPANVAKQVPGVLTNVSNDISAMETPNITVENVLQPLRTSVNYIQPASLVPTPVTIKQDVDPIVGNWIYSGDSKYQCNAYFTSDFKASASCYSWGVSLIQKSFIWTPATTRSFTWMQDYTLTDISDNANYTIAYSEHTGRLTSEILPSNGYLVKVS